MIRPIPSKIRFLHQFRRPDRVADPENHTLLASPVKSVLIVVIALLATLATACDGGTDSRFVRGRSIELHVSNPVVKSKVSFSDDEGRHRVIRPRASNRQLVLVNVTVVNRTSTVMPMLIDREAAELGDRRGERIEVLDPFESSSFVEVPDEHENEFSPLLWGEVLLDRQFQVGGWMIFDVPKGLTIGSLWWNEIDEVVADYVNYFKRG